MPKIQYISKRFRENSLEIISHANTIIDEYQAQGYDLTLRQLYYQFVSRDIIPNLQSEYNKLGSIINDGRLAGMIDWEAIVDRTRNVRSNSHWQSPKEIIDACAKQYRIDRWEKQPERIEAWIEKDALVGVIERICTNVDIAYFSCRGYVSQSEMWSAAQRLLAYLRQGQQVTILHLGDHDPSGIDMTRDIEDRLRLFIDGALGAGQTFDDAVTVKRIALNMNQIRQYNPPPNPAKTTDSRYASYIQNYGAESWELDALEPSVLSGLIEDAVNSIMDSDLWDEAVNREDTEKEKIVKIAKEV
jgi:hypothetical protein